VSKRRIFFSSEFARFEATRDVARDEATPRSDRRVCADEDAFFFVTAQNGTIKSFGHGILTEAEAKKKNAKSREKSAIEIMAEHEREKQAKKEERRVAKVRSDSR